MSQHPQPPGQGGTPSYAFDSGTSQSPSAQWAGYGVQVASPAPDTFSSQGQPLWMHRGPQGCSWLPYPPSPPMDYRTAQSKPLPTSFSPPLSPQGPPPVALVSVTPQVDFDSPEGQTITRLGKNILIHLGPAIKPFCLKDMVAFVKKECPHLPFPGLYGSTNRKALTKHPLPQELDLDLYIELPRLNENDISQIKKALARFLYEQKAEEPSQEQPQDWAPKNGGLRIEKQKNPNSRRERRLHQATIHLGTAFQNASSDPCITKLSLTLVPKPDHLTQQRRSYIFWQEALLTDLTPLWVQTQKKYEICCLESQLPASLAYQCLLANSLETNNPEAVTRRGLTEMVRRLTRGARTHQSPDQEESSYRFLLTTFVQTWIQDIETYGQQQGCSGIHTFLTHYLQDHVGASHGDRLLFLLNLSHALQNARLFFQEQAAQGIPTPSHENLKVLIRLVENFLGDEIQSSLQQPKTPLFLSESEQKTEPIAASSPSSKERSGAEVSDLLCAIEMWGMLRGKGLSPVSSSLARLTNERYYLLPRNGMGSDRLFRLLQDPKKAEALLDQLIPLLDQEIMGGTVPLREDQSWLSIVLAPQAREIQNLLHSYNFQDHPLLQTLFWKWFPFLVTYLPEAAKEMVRILSLLPQQSDSSTIENPASYTLQILDLLKTSALEHKPTAFHYESLSFLKSLFFEENAKVTDSQEKTLIQEKLKSLLPKLFQANDLKLQQLASRFLSQVSPSDSAHWVPTMLKVALEAAPTPTQEQVAWLHAQDIEVMAQGVYTLWQEHGAFGLNPIDTVLGDRAQAVLLALLKRLSQNSFSESSHQRETLLAFLLKQYPDYSWMSFFLSPEFPQGLEQAAAYLPTLGDSAHNWIQPILERAQKGQFLPPNLWAWLRNQDTEILAQAIAAVWQEHDSSWLNSLRLGLGDNAQAVFLTTLNHLSQSPLPESSRKIEALRAFLAEKDSTSLIRSLLNSSQPHLLEQAIHLVQSLSKESERRPWIEPVIEAGLKAAQTQAPLPDNLLAWLQGQSSKHLAHVLEQKWPQQELTAFLSQLHALFENKTQEIFFLILERGLRSEHQTISQEQQDALITFLLHPITEVENHSPDEKLSTAVVPWELHPSSSLLSSLFNTGRSTCLELAVACLPFLSKDLQHWIQIGLDTAFKTEVPPKKLLNWLQSQEPQSLVQAIETLPQKKEANFLPRLHFCLGSQTLEIFLLALTRILTHQSKTLKNQKDALIQELLRLAGASDGDAKEETLSTPLTRLPAEQMQALMQPLLEAQNPQGLELAVVYLASLSKENQQPWLKPILDAAFALGAKNQPLPQQVSQWIQEQDLSQWALILSTMNMKKKAGHFSFVFGTQTQNVVMAWLDHLALSPDKNSSKALQATDILVSDQMASGDFDRVMDTWAHFSEHSSIQQAFFESWASHKQNSFAFQVTTWILTTASLENIPLQLQVELFEQFLDQVNTLKAPEIDAWKTLLETYVSTWFSKLLTSKNPASFFPLWEKLENLQPAVFEEQAFADFQQRLLTLPFVVEVVATSLQKNLGTPAGHWLSHVLEKQRRSHPNFSNHLVHALGNDSSVSFSKLVLWLHVTNQTECLEPAARLFLNKGKSLQPKQKVAVFRVLSQIAKQRKIDSALWKQLFETIGYPLLAQQFPSSEEKHSPEEQPLIKSSKEASLFCSLLAQQDREDPHIRQALYWTLQKLAQSPADIKAEHLSIYEKLLTRQLEQVVAAPENSLEPSTQEWLELPIPLTNKQDPTTYRALWVYGLLSGFVPKTPEFSRRLIKQIPPEEEIKGQEAFVRQRNQWIEAFINHVAPPPGEIRNEFPLLTLYFITIRCKHPEAPSNQARFIEQSAQTIAQYPASYQSANSNACKSFVQGVTYFFESPWQGDLFAQPALKDACRRIFLKVTEYWTHFYKQSLSQNKMNNAASLRGSFEELLIGVRPLYPQNPQLLGEMILALLRMEDPFAFRKATDLLAQQKPHVSQWLSQDPEDWTKLFALLKAAIARIHTFGLEVDSNLEKLNSFLNDFPLLNTEREKGISERASLWEVLLKKVASFQSQIASLENDSKKRRLSSFFFSFINTWLQEPSLFRRSPEWMKAGVSLFSCLSDSAQKELLCGHLLSSDCLDPSDKNTLIEILYSSIEAYDGGPNSSAATFEFIVRGSDQVMRSGSQAQRQALFKRLDQFFFVPPSAQEAKASEESVQPHAYLAPLRHYFQTLSLPDEANEASQIALRCEVIQNLGALRETDSLSAAYLFTQYEPDPVQAQQHILSLLKAFATIEEPSLESFSFLQLKRNLFLDPTLEAEWMTTLREVHQKVLQVVKTPEDWLDSFVILNSFAENIIFPSNLHFFFHLFQETAAWWLGLRPQDKERLSQSDFQQQPLSYLMSFYHLAQQAGCGSQETDLLMLENISDNSLESWFCSDLIYGSNDELLPCPRTFVTLCENDRISEERNAQAIAHLFQRLLARVSTQDQKSTSLLSIFFNMMRRVQDLDQRHERDSQRWDPLMKQAISILAERFQQPYIPLDHDFLASAIESIGFWKKKDMIEGEIKTLRFVIGKLSAAYQRLVDIQHNIRGEYPLRQQTLIALESHLAPWTMQHANLDAFQKPNIQTWTIPTAATQQQLENRFSTLFSSSVFGSSSQSNEAKENRSNSSSSKRKRKKRK